MRGEARGLGEIGGLAVAMDHPAVRRGGVRAAQLTEVADAHDTLIGLGCLLADVGIALVGVACATDEEGLYWQCIEAIDAADESNDRVRGMLRRLAARDPDRPPDTIRGRAGPPALPGRAAPEPPASAVSKGSKIPTPAAGPDTTGPRAGRTAARPDTTGPGAGTAAGLDQPGPAGARGAAEPAWPGRRG